MKGILFQNSNVVFAAQKTSPADVHSAKDPSVATDPLAHGYGMWQAVENSGIAIADAANLLLIPGRKCSNERDVPLANADWCRAFAKQASRFMLRPKRKDQPNH